MKIQDFEIERLTSKDGGGYFIYHKIETTIMTDSNTKQKAIMKMKKLLNNWKWYKYPEIWKKIKKIRNKY